jgi:hypothetical protein
LRLCRLLSLVAMLVVSSVLFAQTNTTSLSGVVTDASGAVIQGASVTIFDAAKGVTKNELSKSKGEFEFPQIAPGHYKVTVSFLGFSDSERELELLVASPQKIDVKLSVGSAETVSVEATGAPINTTDGTLGKPFDSVQIQTLPYQADNVLSLLSLQPGVQSLDPGGKSGGLNQDSRNGIVNGARQDQSNVTLDGVDDNDQNNGYAFNGVLRATRESVEEFRVVTSNPNADSGRSSGAQVSLVTRSGTNAFHGSAYEYYRDPGVSANDWFLKQAQIVSGEPNIAAKILQHTFGGSFGAPIVKDKLFFFGAYEAFKQASDSVETGTVPSVMNPAPGVPTINGYGGLITQTVSYLGCPTSDAQCNNSAPSVYTLQKSDIAAIDPNCFASGACPSGPGVDAAAIAYFNQFPLANSTNTGDGYNTGGYVFTSPAPQSLITNIARIDYNINNKQVLFVRGNLQSDNLESPVQFPGGPANSNTYGNSKGIAAGHIWNITNSLTNNFRYGYIRQDQAVRGATHAGYVSFDAVSNLTSTNTSTVNKVPLNNFIDDVTFIKGRHTIQFGVNDRLISNFRYADITLYPQGNVTADLLATAAIAGKGTSLDPGAFGYAPVYPGFDTFYNSAILGAVGGITYSQQYINYQIQGNSLVPLGAVEPTRHYKSNEQEYYVQDSWKVSQRLTLTGGVRYSYLGVPYETNGQEVAPTTSLLDLLKNRVAAAASGAAATGNPYNTRISVTPAGSANGQPNLWTPQKTNFAPRFAFAYATNNDKTSIRGGFGIVYDHFGQGVIDDYDANGAFTLNTLVNTYYGGVDFSPRFTGYNDVPLTPVSPATQQFPITPADQNFSFVSSIDNKLKTPYAETFNLTVQHELPGRMTLTGTYVGRLGRHVLANLDVAQPSNVYDPGSGMTYFQAITAIDKLVDAGADPSTVPNMKYWQDIFPNASRNVTDANGNVITYTGTQAIYASIQGGDRGNETDTLFNNDVVDSNPNAACPAAGTGPSLACRFFYPQYSSIYVQSSSVSSNYNALQLSLRQSLKYGFQYDVNYTYGKSMDYASEPERRGSGSNRIINTFDPHQNYAVSDFDVRHNITANYILALPFGRGALFASNINGFLDRIIGGWTVDGLVHYSTSLPFSAQAANVYGTNFAEPSLFIQTGPIASGGHRYVPNNGAPYETALKNMTATQAEGNLRFAYPGEAGQRNNFRADGYLSLDNGVSKSFTTWREQKLKISIEVFNVLNDVRFNTQGVDSQGLPINISNTTNGSSVQFAQYNSLLVQPRQMQFSAKYNF